jgi:P4 family phage/plasmid primase-like protien
MGDAKLESRKKEIARYLACLDPKADAFSFQTFDDTKKDDTLTRQFHGPFDEDRFYEFYGLTLRSAGIHVVVNRTDFQGLANKNILGCRAIFLDFDEGEPPGELLAALSPTMQVRSRRGPHLYWCLSEEALVEDWQAAMAAVLARWGADPSSGRTGADPHGQVLTGDRKKPAKVPPCQKMRIPGFDNSKKKPGLHVKLEYAYPERRYTLAQIVEALGADAPKRAPVPMRAGPSKDHPLAERIERARRYLEAVAGAAEGGRNNHVVGNAAPIGGDFGLTEQEFWPILRDWNTRKNTPPLEEKQLAAIMKASYGYRSSPLGCRLDEHSQSYTRKTEAHRQDEESSWESLINEVDKVAEDIPEVDATLEHQPDFQVHGDGLMPTKAAPEPARAWLYGPERPDLPDEEYEADESEVEEICDEEISPFISKPGPDKFAMSEFGNMMRFLSKHGTNVRFCETMGCWLYWDGKRWVEDRDALEGEAYRATGAVRSMADTFFNNLQNKVTLLPLEEQPDWRDFCLRSVTETQVSAALAKAGRRRRIAIAPSLLDRHHHILNTAMGPFDLKRGVLMTPQRRLYLSKITQVSCGQFDDCPAWFNFLCRIFRKPDGTVDLELIYFLQKAIGYSLTGETGEQCLFLMYGTGANGKTTFLNAILDIMGEYGMQSDFSTFQEQQGERVRSDLARLHRARFVAANEPKQGKRLDEATIKGLTGQDKIVCRFLFKNEFTYVPTFKVWLSSNHKPEIRGTDEGIWRRLMLIPFTSFIAPEERDPELPEKLKRERSGILRWAMEGAQHWYKEALKPPAVVQEATKGYREEMDILGNFFAARCLIKDDAVTRSRVLYTAYKRWAGEANVYVMSEPRFSRQIKDRGFRIRSMSHGNEFCGVGLLEDPDKATHGDARSGDHERGREREWSRDRD